MRQRIGIYGGTFDPIHNGHLKVAEAILNAFAMDLLLFVPAYVPPHKRRVEISSPFHRLAMLVLATARSRKMFVSSIELEAPSRPYTIDTLRQLQSHYENALLFFVMGTDSFKDVTSWRDYAVILSEYNCIVAVRPSSDDPKDDSPEDSSEECHNDSHHDDSKDIADHLDEDLQARIVDLRGKKSLPKGTLKLPRIYLTDYVKVGVSATDVREKASRGEPIDDMVPKDVARYIVKYRLYQ
ncbi:MAG: nicotinate-nucleotide adenylyltransferase [Acidobacteria bacterium]|nr:nicotinate-nucleotide adenylyltransferase [Acidobacteriota bacterium]